MKTLFIIRHAKSSWDDPTLADIDRPLNGRGKKDAPEMGRRLKSRSVMPDLMISSTAKRARKTARKIAGEIGYEKNDIILLNSLYHAGVTTIHEVVRQTQDYVDTLMIFGHNPGFTDFANFIARTEIYNIPTCGIVQVEFNTTNWLEVAPLNGKLVDFDYPKKDSG